MRCTSGNRHLSLSLAVHVFCYLDTGFRYEVLRPIKIVYVKSLVRGVCLGPSQRGALRPGAPSGMEPSRPLAAARARCSDARRWLLRRDMRLWTCDDCKEAYREWLCTSVFQRCGGSNPSGPIVRPCDDTCWATVRKCPATQQFSCPNNVRPCTLLPFKPLLCMCVGAGNPKPSAGGGSGVISIDL